MNEEPADISVTTLAYSAKRNFAAGGMLLRNEAKPRCKIGRPTELLRITNCRKRRRRAESAASRDGHQTAGPIIKGGQTLDLPI